MLDDSADKIPQSFILKLLPGEKSTVSYSVINVDKRKQDVLKLILLKPLWNKDENRMKVHILFKLTKYN